MFQFQANIVRRRRISKSTTFLGFASVGILGYLGYTLVKYGNIPILDELVRQIGLSQYLFWAYLIVGAFLMTFVIPAAYTLFRKRVLVGGYVSFDQENLTIVYGKDTYVIPEEKLTKIDFDIRNLSEGTILPAIGTAKDVGGSYMKIPTQKGKFTCELNIKTNEQRQELINMIQYLKIQHDVEIRYKEV